MPDTRVPPHESEEFRCALESLGGQAGRGWSAGADIVSAMRARGDDPLPGALRSEDDRVRFLSVRAMQCLGAESDVELILPMLADRHWNTRVGAIYALEHFPDERSVSAVLPMLDDPHPRVRSAAAWILGWFADPRAAAPLLERARVVEGDEVQPVRDALSSLTATALDEVVAALRDDDAQVRRIAADALARAADMLVVAPQVEDRLGLTEDNEGAHLRPAIPALIDALDDPDPQVRASIRETLTALADDPRTEEALRRALNDAEGEDG